MAISDTTTLLPLDTYASIMGIDPNQFNQVINPAYVVKRECNAVWLQTPMVRGEIRTIGRDQVARAIADAEMMITRGLGYPPAPTWVLDDQVRWPRPRRGYQIVVPEVFARYGYIIEGGREDTTTIIDDHAPVTYTDENGDGIVDTAHISLTAAQMTAAGASISEIAVYPLAEYLHWHCVDSETSRIRPLRICLDDAGDVDIQGHRSQFVIPSRWLTGEDLYLDIVTNFLSHVVIRRRWTNPAKQAQLQWNPIDLSICGGVACTPTCNSGCIIIDDRRTSLVRVLPATYSAGAWTYSTPTQCYLPMMARLWYLAGYYRRTAGWMECDWPDHPIAEAIVRLANCYLPDIPCGCSWTQERWNHDREEVPITNVDSARAMSTFGTTMRGALFAWSVVKRLGPIAGGGSI